MRRIGSASLAGAASPVGLDTPSPASPGRYRRTFRFAIPTPGAPARIEIAPDTVFDLAFAPRIFDALASGAPERASLNTGGAGLVLRLPVPRQVARVRLTTSNPGDEVAAFRFDGRAVSGEPVAIGTHSASLGATLDVTDSQLILRRRRGGAFHALSAGDIASVIVAVLAQNGRVGMEIVSSTEGISYLPPRTSEQGQPVFPAAAQWGPDLASTLETAIARFATQGPSPMPNPLQVDLIAEADTPCDVTVSAFDLGYLLERVEQPDGLDKAVLRFPGGRREARDVRFNGVAGIDVVRASVSLTAAQKAPSADTTADVALPDLGQLASTGLGIAVAAGSVAATRRSLAAPELVTGVQVIAGAVDPGGAEATFVLHSENAGLPGAILGESHGLHLRAGRPELTEALLGTPIVLPAGPVWLSLRMRRGRAIVALVTEPGARIVTGDGTLWSGVPPSEGAGGAIALLVTAREGDASRASLEALVAGRALPVTADGADHSAEFASLAGGFPAPPFALTIRSAAAGPVTVGPLVVRYVPAS